MNKQSSRPTVIGAVSLLSALCLWGCTDSGAANQYDDDPEQPLPGDALPGYGDGDIGLRSGAIGDGEGGSDGDGDMDADSDSDSDSDTDTDVDSDSDVDEDTDSGGSIDPSFLSDHSLADPWVGFLYDGPISMTPWDAVDGTTVILQGSIGGAALPEDVGPGATVWSADGNLYSSAETVTGEYTPTGEGNEWYDAVRVSSIFNSDALELANNEPSVDQTFPTLVLRNTYERTPDADVLRSTCAVATTRPDMVGQPGNGSTAAVGIVAAASSPYVAALAHVTALTQDPDLMGAQFDDAFTEMYPMLQGTTDLCICFDVDGTTPMDCSGLPSAPALPAKAPDGVTENSFYTVTEMSTSTFSIDVDTASYTLVRQSLANGTAPAPGNVRIEEMINYFAYNYEVPGGDNPFTVYTELADCPWNPARRLVMIGLRGQEIQMDEQPPANLVYLLDVSGSMAEEMWLIKPAFRMLVEQMRPQDTVSIVTYAGNEAVVIEGAGGDEKAAMLEAIEYLESGGSTNGEGGINKAYELAEQYFVEGGNNRVILATDGDFNVGLSGTDALTALAREKAQTGIYLTVYGFSTWSSGNYQDETMEQLADNGNGNYFFIDGAEEAQRAFAHSLSGTLLTIAKDVKLQVQFNPDMVKGYRLIGYDNRVLANDDFDDDTVDAGELGNNEDVTAFYELIPASSDEEVPPTDQTTDPNAGDEDDYEALADGTFMAIRLRYKLPESDESLLITHPVTRMHSVETPSPKFVFASTIAQAGLVLRHSDYIADPDLTGLPARLDAAFGQTDNPAVAELRSFIDLAVGVQQGQTGNR